MPMIPKIETFRRSHCPLCEQRDRELENLRRELQRSIYARNCAQSAMIQMETKLQMARSDSFDRESGLRHAINACGGVGPLAARLGVQQFVIRAWLDSD